MISFEKNHEYISESGVAQGIRLKGFDYKFFYLASNISRHFSVTTETSWKNVSSLIYGEITQDALKYNELESLPERIRIVEKAIILLDNLHIKLWIYPDFVNDQVGKAFLNHVNKFPNMERNAYYKNLRDYLERDYEIKIIKEKFGFNNHFVRELMFNNGRLYWASSKHRIIPEILFLKNCIEDYKEYGIEIPEEFNKLIDIYEESVNNCLK